MSLSVRSCAQLSLNHSNWELMKKNYLFFEVMGLLDGL